MKTTGFIQRKISLKSYSHLTTRVGLKRSRFVHKMPDTPTAILDGIVSQMVRRSAADSSGIATCVTCGGRAHWKHMDCGHFQKRGNLTTRFHYKNLGVQCKGCNRDNNGENEKFAVYIDSMYGPGTAEALEAEARLTAHDFPFAEEAAKWQVKLDALVAQQDMEIQY